MEVMRVNALKWVLSLLPSTIPFDTLSLTLDGTG